MKLFLKIIGICFAAVVIGVIAIVLLMPWMDRWGASANEISATLPGDELVTSPRYIYNRVVTVDAAPEQIYPWLVQLGAEKGGMYSYSWFETNVLHCELINADQLHPEWQTLKVGDKVKMCPGNSGPPAYEVAMLVPNQAIVMGHQENGRWSDVWQFVLLPQADGSTRMIVRGRNALEGLLWDVIRPGEFVMMRGMMLGIKERAEGMVAR